MSTVKSFYRFQPPPPQPPPPAEAVAFNRTQVGTISNFQHGTSKTLTMSFWVLPRWFSIVSGNSSSTVFSTAATIEFSGTHLNTIDVRLNHGAVKTNPELNMNFRTHNDTVILSVDSTNVSFDVWNHVLLSFDNATSTWHYYINGIAGQTAPIQNNVAITWDCLELKLGTEYLAQQRKLDGDLAEVYLSQEYIDFSLQANREKFILNGAPVNLGSLGTLPTGNQPIIFQRGDAATWNSGVNYGSGADFTWAGTLTDSVNEPVELP